MVMESEGGTESSDAAGAPILDLEQIDGLISAAGVDGAKDIMDAFWRSTDRLLADLKALLSAGDFDGASRSAHALKGSALNVGAIGLSCSARGIEDACRMSDAAYALKRLDTAHGQYEETAAAFAARFATAA